MPYPSLMRGVPATLLPALTTTGTGTGHSVPSSFKDHTVIVKGTGTITGGTIVIEEAATPDYSGTWSVITTVNGTDVTGGAQKAIHFAAVERAVRARIGSDITGGGSVEVEITSA